jgi:hypothetical protein
MVLPNAHKFGTFQHTSSAGMARLGTWRDGLEFAKKCARPNNCQLLSLIPFAIPIGQFATITVSAV